MRFFLLLTVFVLVIYPALVTSLPSLSDDVLGLVVFKSDIQDPQGKLTSWSEDDDTPCNWSGVKCNPRSNRVSELVLDGFGLSGRLGRGLLQLRFLRKLSLARNNLTGSVSLSFEQLSTLKVLDLSENGLTLMPTDLFRQCRSLRSISLGGNKLSGRVPVSLSSCSSLVSVNLSSNLFLGQLNLGFSSLPLVRSLDLSDNVLEGEIPEGVESLSSLRVLNLKNNRFTGEIPSGIGKCLLLKSIDLSGNSLSGELPSTMRGLLMCNNLILSRNGLGGKLPDWFGEMRSLETLDLSGNSFRGRVPVSFGKLQSLKILNVSKNALTGSMPESISNCVNLLVCDVSHNLLTGSLPSWLFKLGLQSILFANNRLSGSLDSAFRLSIENSRDKVVVFDLSQNKLSGEIPSAVGDFHNLQSLKMAKNSFVGSIPASIGQLKSLHVLDLRENRLNDSIPLEIGGLVSLNHLGLQKNSLGGIIPVSIGDCTSLMSLSLAHNEITGPVPSSLAKITRLRAVDFSFNYLNGPLPEQLADLVHLKSFNISHNQLLGELPAGGFFSTISPSSLSANPSICGEAVNKTCSTSIPKPIVLDPNSTEATPDTISPAFSHRKKILSISALFAIGAAVLIAIGVIAITVLNLRVRSSSTPKPPPVLTFSGGYDFTSSPSSDSDSGKLVMFSGDHEFKTGAHPLLNKDCELGRGGFGAMYRAMLRNGRSVAIKKLNIASLVKSQDEFEKEIKKLGQVRHENLVALTGYYWTQSLQLLIYEFVSGENLYKCLHDESSGNSLSWNERLNIILGTAKGLAHLHEMDIIHYNLKSSNILVDSCMEPKVSDYGLARLLPMLDRYVLSSKIQSALGYMAPEFACKTVKITEKSDVYGFGILVLEIITGKRPVEYLEDDVIVLCDMVRAALDEGRVDECVDIRLQGVFTAEEAIPIIKLGLICTSQVPSNRPDMARVVTILELMKCQSDIQDEFSDSS